VVRPVGFLGSRPWTGGFLSGRTGATRPRKGVGHKMINARAETVRQKPSFLQALLKRRCLIPAHGFFEWRGAGWESTPAPSPPRSPMSWWRRTSDS